MASHFWTLAVPWMPRCWIAKMMSIRMPPMTKVALRLALARKGMSKVISDQLRIAGVKAVIASLDRRAEIASCGALPALAASHSATRGLSAVSVAILALIHSITAGLSAPGMGKRALRI